MPERVLVVRPDNAGDVLLAGPAVRAVARNATVALLCGPNGRAAAELLPGVSTLIEARLPWIDPHPPPVEGASIAALVESVGKGSFDKAIVLTSFHQSALPTALVLRMAGVPFVAAVSEDYPGSLLDVRHRVSDDVHEVARNLSLVAACGYHLAPEDDDRLQMRLPAASPLPPAFHDYVVVHPGASVPARRWAPESSAALVRELDRKGRRVVVTGAPSERLLTDFVSGDSDHVIDAGGTTTFAELAAIIAGARAIVVGNTGPAHIAAAVGTPVVSLYAPTVPAVRWRPWRVPHVLMGLQDIACAGCRARTCPFDHHPCLSAVAVEDVADAVARLTASGSEASSMGVRS